MERWTGRECGGIRRAMLDKQTRVTSKKSSQRKKKREEVENIKLFKKVKVLDEGMQSNEKCRIIYCITSFKKSALNS